MTRRPSYSLLAQHGVAIAERDGGWHCRYCAVPLVDPRVHPELLIPSGDGFTVAPGHQFATIDHFIPLVQGGSNRRENLVLACMPCNRLKGARLVSVRGMP